MRVRNLLACVGLAFGLTLANQAFAEPTEKAEKAFVALAPLESEALKQAAGEGWDDPKTERVPNYLRALAVTHPKAVGSFAHLFKTVLCGGSVSPNVKLAMGLRIAQMNGSPYLSRHLLRLSKILQNERSVATASPAYRIGVLYAEHLAKAVRGVTDNEFMQARGVYNDAEIVELTATTCFFNYFSRFCNGAGLPLEAWASESPNGQAKLAERKIARARVTLATDEELEMGSTLLKRTVDPRQSLGFRIANSQRAMLRVPDIGAAWWGYWQDIRTETKLGRPDLLHISFAVSTLNECRYCVLHQVGGLSRAGVSISKLQSMRESDALLSPKEKTLTDFARKLTSSPQTVAAQDYEALRAGVADDAEAVDALLQTCAFNFMNRFTDGLRLPSEDEAIHTYQEVYGDKAYEKFYDKR